MEEKEYEDCDIVWVKLGNCWWPGEVCYETRLPAGILKSVKKRPLYVVQFFDENKYEYVKNKNNICKYNDNRKNDFIKKGLDLLRRQKKYMEKFPDDVSKAEQLTGGDPEIVKSTQFNEEIKKPSYASIFGVTDSGGKKKVGRKQKTVTPKKTSPAVSVRTSFSVMTTPILPQTNSPDSYNCKLCSFTTNRCNIMIIHMKTHTRTSLTPKGNDSAALLSPLDSTPAGKPDKTDYSEIENVLRRKLQLQLAQESNDEDEPDPQPQPIIKLPPKARKTPKKPGLKHLILADWSEDEDDEESRAAGSEPRKPEPITEKLPTPEKPSPPQKIRNIPKKDRRDIVLNEFNSVPIANDIVERQIVEKEPTPPPLSVENQQPEMPVAIESEQASRTDEEEVEEEPAQGTRKASCFDFKEDEDENEDFLSSLSKLKEKYLTPEKQNSNEEDQKLPSTGGDGNEVEKKDEQLAADIENLLNVTQMPELKCDSEIQSDVRALPPKERGKRIFKSRNRSKLEKSIEPETKEESLERRHEETDEKKNVENRENVEPVADEVEKEISQNVNLQGVAETRHEVEEVPELIESETILNDSNGTEPNNVEDSESMDSTAVELSESNSNPTICDNEHDLSVLAAAETLISLPSSVCPDNRTYVDEGEATETNVSPTFPDDTETKSSVKEITPEKTSRRSTAKRRQPKRTIREVIDVERKPEDENPEVVIPVPMEIVEKGEPAKDLSEKQPNLRQSGRNRKREAIAASPELREVRRTTRNRTKKIEEEETKVEKIEEDVVSEFEPLPVVSESLTTEANVVVQADKARRKKGRRKQTIKIDVPSSKPGERLRGGQESIFIEKIAVQEEEAAAEMAEDNQNTDAETETLPDVSETVANIPCAEKTEEIVTLPENLVSGDEIQLSPDDNEYIFSEDIPVTANASEIVVEVSSEGFFETDTKICPKNSPEIGPEICLEVDPGTTVEVVTENSIEAISENSQEVAQEAMQESVPGAAEESVPEAAEESIPEATQAFISEASQEFVQEATPKFVREPIEESIPEATQEFDAGTSQELVQDAAQEFVPEATQEFVQEATPDFVPEATQEFVQETTQEYFQEVTQEFAHEATQEFVPETTQEFNPEPSQESISEAKTELAEAEAAPEYISETSSYFVSEAMTDFATEATTETVSKSEADLPTEGVQDVITEPTLETTSDPPLNIDEQSRNVPFEGLVQSEPSNETVEEQPVEEKIVEQGEPSVEVDHRQLANEEDILGACELEIVEEIVAIVSSNEIEEMESAEAEIEQPKTEINDEVGQREIVAEEFLAENTRDSPTKPELEVPIVETVPNFENDSTELIISEGNLNEQTEIGLEKDVEEQSHHFDPALLDLPQTIPEIITTSTANDSIQSDNVLSSPEPNTQIAAEVTIDSIKQTPPSSAETSPKTPLQASPTGSSSGGSDTKITNKRRLSRFKVPSPKSTTAVATMSEDIQERIKVYSFDEPTDTFESPKKMRFSQSKENKTESKKKCIDSDYTKHSKRSGGHEKSPAERSKHSRTKQVNLQNISDVCIPKYPKLDRTKRLTQQPMESNTFSVHVTGDSTSPGPIQRTSSSDMTTFVQHSIKSSPPARASSSGSGASKQQTKRSPKQSKQQQQIAVQNFLEGNITQSIELSGQHRFDIINKGSSRTKSSRKASIESYIPAFGIVSTKEKKGHVISSQTIVMSTPKLTPSKAKDIIKTCAADPLFITSKGNVIASSSSNVTYTPASFGTMQTTSSASHQYALAASNPNHPPPAYPTYLTSTSVSQQPIVSPMLSKVSSIVGTAGQISVATSTTSTTVRTDAASGGDSSGPSDIPSLVPIGAGSMPVDSHHHHHQMVHGKAFAVSRRSPGTLTKTPTPSSQQIHDNLLTVSQSFEPNNGHLIREPKQNMMGLVLGQQQPPVQNVLQTQPVIQQKPQQQQQINFYQSPQPELPIRQAGKRRKNDQDRKNDEDPLNIQLGETQNKQMKLMQQQQQHQQQNQQLKLQQEEQMKLQQQLLQQQQQQQQHEQVRIQQLQHEEQLRQEQLQIQLQLQREQQLQLEQLQQEVGLQPDHQEIIIQQSEEGDNIIGDQLLVQEGPNTFYVDLKNIVTVIGNTEGEIAAVQLASGETLLVAQPIDGNDNRAEMGDQIEIDGRLLLTDAIGEQIEVGNQDILFGAVDGDSYQDGQLIGNVLHIETTEQPMEYQLINNTKTVTATTNETNAIMPPIMSTLEMPSSKQTDLVINGGGATGRSVNKPHDNRLLGQNLDNSLAVIGVTSQSQTVPTSLELPITITNPAIAAPKTSNPIAMGNIYGQQSQISPPLSSQDASQLGYELFTSSNVVVTHHDQHANIFSDGSSFKTHHHNDAAAQMASSLDNNCLNEIILQSTSGRSTDGILHQSNDEYMMSANQFSSLVDSQATNNSNSPYSNSNR